MWATADPGSGRAGDRGDRREQLRDGLARQAAGNEDQSGSVVGVRPVLEFDRWMGNVLDEMNNDRSAAFCHRDEPFDA